MHVQLTTYLQELNAAVLNADGPTRFIMSVLDENLIKDNVRALLPLVYENAADVICAGIPHFFQTHLDAWKNRRLEAYAPALEQTDMPNVPVPAVSEVLDVHNAFPQKFTSDPDRLQVALKAAREAGQEEMARLLTIPGVLGHAVFLDLPAPVQYDFLLSKSPAERGQWLKVQRKDGSNAFLKMTLEQIATLSQGLSKNDRLQILDATDVLGHNVLHHFAIKRRNALYYAGTVTPDKRQKIYDSTVAAVKTMLGDMEPIEQFSYLSLHNQEGLTPLHGLSGYELKNIIGQLPSDVRINLMTLKTHVYDLDMGWVRAGVLEPIFHENVRKDDLISTADIMDLTADFTPAQNALFFAAPTTNGIAGMFCLAPEEQAQKLSTMTFEQKRQFLFPFALIQMEGDDIVQSIQNLPLNKKIQLLLHPAGITDKYLNARCLFDCLDMDQKGQIVLGLTPDEWQHFKSHRIPKKLIHVKEVDSLFDYLTQTFSCPRLADMCGRLEQVDSWLNASVNTPLSVITEQAKPSAVPPDMMNAPSASKGKAQSSLITPPPVVMPSRPTR